MDCEGCNSMRTAIHVHIRSNTVIEHHEHEDFCTLGLECVETGSYLSLFFRRATVDRIDAMVDHLLRIREKVTEELTEPVAM